MRIAIVLGLAVLVLLAGFGWNLARDAGIFRTVSVTHPSDCRVVEGAPGAEDIVFNRQTGYALVSSQHRRAAVGGRPVPGAIYRYRPGEPDSLVNLTLAATIDFRPHGISLVTNDQGRQRLFVINHPGGNLFDRREDWPEHRPRHTIEVFDLIGERLVHVETLADDSVHSPNDLVAVDFDRFYVTNDHGTESGWKRTVEDWLRWPWANVVYFDGSRYSIAATGLNYANGINLSRDRRRLFVAEVTRNRLREFSRDPSTGELSELRSIPVGFGVDNIDVDPASGDLWLAGHPKLLRFLAHARNADQPSPSKAIQIDPHAGVAGRVVFADDGTLLSGSSVVVPAGDRLLLGAVFSPHFVDCARPGNNSIKVE